MKPINSNSFDDRNRDVDDDRQYTFRRDDTAANAPCQAALVETEHGWSIKVSPMRIFDALRVWRHLTGHQEEHSQLRTLVIDGTGLSPITGELRNVRCGATDEIEESRGRAEPIVPRSHPLPSSSAPPKFPPSSPSPVSGQEPSLKELAERNQLPVEEVFGDRALLLDELTLRELATFCPRRSLHCILIDGPVETGDVRAIQRMIEARQSPLAAELRAVAALKVCDGEVLTLDTRKKADALRLASEMLRQYLASIGRRPVTDFSGPETWQLDRLLGVSGSISVRPRETDWYSNSVDVGISTEIGGHTRPADCSLIYDLPSGTWHDEE